MLGEHTASVVSVKDVGNTVLGNICNRLPDYVVS